MPDQGFWTRRIFTGTALQLATRGFTAACMMTALALIRRKVGAEGFGVFHYFSTWLLLCGTLIDFGGITTAVRDVAANPGRRDPTLRALLVTRFLIAIACSSTLAALTIASSASWDRMRLGGAALLLVPTALSAAIAHFQVRLRYVPIALASMLGHAAFLVAVARLDANSVRNAEPYVLAYAAGLSIASLTVFAASLREVRWLGLVQRSDFAQLWRGMLPLGLSGLVAVAYLNIDTALLKHFNGDRAAGEYNDAFKIAALVMAAAGYFGQALLPALTRPSATQVDLATRVREAGAGLLWVILPAAAMTPFAGPSLLRLLWGENSDGSCQSLVSLAIAAIAVYLTVAPLQALFALHRQSAYLRIGVAALAFKLTIGVWWIAERGANGAAAATAVAEWLVLALVTLQLRRELKAPVLPAASLPILAAVLCAAAIYTLRDNHPAVVVTSAASLEVLAAWVGVRFGSSRNPGLILGTPHDPETERKRAGSSMPGRPSITGRTRAKLRSRTPQSAGALAKRLRNVIQKNDDVGYLGSSVELPYVMAEGRSVESCFRNTLRALAGAIEVMQERGIPLPRSLSIKRTPPSSCSRGS